MFGSRKLIEKYNGVDEDINDRLELKKLLRQAKQISQIIAYIWLNQDDKTARTLHEEYFKKPDKLHELLFAQPTDENKKPSPYTLLKAIFDEKYLPIFDHKDRDYFDFKVIFNAFEGEIIDAERGETKWIMCIPYPSRPIISHNQLGTTAPDQTAPLTKQELEEWVKSQCDQAPYSSTNPYIPTTCS